MPEVEPLAILGCTVYFIWILSNDVLLSTARSSKTQCLSDVTRACRLPNATRLRPPGGEEFVPSEAGRSSENCCLLLMLHLNMPPRCMCSLAVVRPNPQVRLFSSTPFFYESGAKGFGLPGRNRDPAYHREGQSSGWRPAHDGAARAAKEGLRVSGRAGYKEGEDRFGRVPRDRPRKDHYTNWRPRENGGKAEPHSPTNDPTRWAPTKKLTFTAMAALRALHQSNPELNNRAALGEKFGISYDAVGRILRSRFEHR